MQEHKKNYIKFFKIGWYDNIPCEMNCGSIADDFHHINYRSHQGEDNVENIIAVCRSCHTLIHAGIIKKIEAQKRHNLKIKCFKSIQNH